MQKHAVWVGLAVTLILVIATGAWLVMAKPSLRGAVIDPPVQAADIRLQDYNNGAFDMSSLRGKVVLLYFGYTNCPDECPLTMAHLKLAMDQLGNEASNVRVIMVTSDPKRDTPAVLKSWLTKFRPDFIGLTGTPDALAKVYKDYGVTVEDNGETHSYLIYVIDPRGAWRETFLPDSLSSDIAADVRVLLRER